MRKLLTIFFTGITVFALAQKTQSSEANAILKKVQDKLSSLHQVSYQHTRETHYYADNYYNLFKTDLYIDFTAPGPLNLRFQADEMKSGFIYTGNATLRLNKENATIDSATVSTAKGMQNNSYLYHSVYMLRNMLAVVLANDSISRSVKDTLIGQKKYYSVTIEGSGMYFQLLGGVERFNIPELRRPYYLIIDKKTFLPYQFISKYIRGTDDRDFVTVTYNNINTHPDAPANDTWLYSKYAGSYKPYQKPVKIPLVKNGTKLADFTLPNYTSSGIDSVSLSQYAGKVVLVDFWFKTCGPCMEAMPHYNDLQNKFAKDGFQLLTVNVEDPVEDVKFFYNKHQPVYKMLYDGGKLWSGLGFTGCPSAVLLDKSGKVVQSFFGFDKELIEKKIQELVN